ncbi:MAG: hypothetical protein IJD47_00335 [Clostridia bacterium]|nr:hypothetical protein [Clostridia bacterium]
MGKIIIYLSAKFVYRFADKIEFLLCKNLFGKNVQTLFTKVDNGYIIDVLGGKWFVTFVTSKNGYFGGFV